MSLYEYKLFKYYCFHVEFVPTFHLIKDQANLFNFVWFMQDLFKNLSHFYALYKIIYNKKGASAPHIKLEISGRHSTYGD